MGVRMVTNRNGVTKVIIEGDIGDIVWIYTIHDILLWIIEIVSRRNLFYYLVTFRRKINDNYSPLLEFTMMISILSD